MIETKDSKPPPLIKNDRDRNATFECLLSHVRDAHKHLSLSVSSNQKLRFAEQVEAYRRIALILCGQEIRDTNVD